MGGLLVMGIFKYFAKYMDELILLAPAGLQDSVIYNKILFNLPVRQLFKWTSNKPKFSSKLLEMSKKYGWLDRLTHVFFSRQLGDDKLRKRMFNNLSSLFFFPRRLSQFRRLIRKYNIEFLIYYGQRDSLKQESAGKKFSKILQRRKKTVNFEIKLVNDDHFFIRGTSQ